VNNGESRYQVEVNDVAFVKSFVPVVHRAGKAPDIVTYLPKHYSGFLLNLLANSLTNLIYEHV